MKDVTIIVPLHEYDDTVGKYLTEALTSVERCRKQYDKGKLPVMIVATPDVEKQLKANDAKKFIQDLTIVVNDGASDFCSQVNYAVDQVKTEFFSILEYDDEYRDKWFKQASEYFYGNESISIFLPINVQHTNRTNWGFGNEFGLSNAFITDDVDDTDDIGIVNFKRMENCSVFNLTGAIFNLSDFVKVGKYKPSIKVAFNYELLLRLTNKGLKCMVVPKEGYVHEIGRAGSLTGTYNETMTQEEVDKWFELAYREYVHDTDRNKTINLGDEEELK